MRYLLLTLATFLSLASQANAAPDRCTEITPAPNAVITVEAALHHSTRITMPDQIVRDIGGNLTFDGNDKGLWEATADGRHYWIKPSDTDSEDGASMSLSLILADGKVYDFNVRRVDTVTMPCLVVRDRLSSFGSVLTGGSTRAGAAAGAAVVAEDDNLPPYTRYEWKKREGLIEGVSDDGRYTYVRLAPRPAGAELPVLQGGTKKNPTLVDAQYDTSSHTYKVAGIHESLTLRVGRKAIEIDRE